MRGGRWEGSNKCVKVYYCAYHLTGCDFYFDTHGGHAGSFSQHYIVFIYNVKIRDLCLVWTELVLHQVQTLYTQS